MYLEQLSLRIPGDEFRLRFHRRLTVLAGIGVLERRALIDSVFSSLTGGAESTVLAVRDVTGRAIEVTTEGGRLGSTYDDGTPAPGPLELVGKDAKSLRTLMLLTAADLGLHGSGREGEPAELAEARATLAALTDELDAAHAARQAVDAMGEELEAIDDRIRRHEDDKSRRQYARLLADLERVRAESLALRGGRGGSENDRHILRSADATRARAASWTEAVHHVTELAAAFGEKDRLDARTLADAVNAPDHAPEDIDVLTAALEDAEAERLDLSVRLREMSASRLAEPSDPAVTELARQDQGILWAAQRRTADTAASVAAHSLALGGVGSAAVTDEIERQHDEVVEAEAMIQKKRVAGWASGGGGLVAGVAAVAVAPLAAPVVLVGAAGAAGWMLLRPKHRLARAQRRELEALEAAGAPSYLSFHLRRVDAIIDPHTREALELATLEHRMAVAAWSELATGIGPDAAGLLQDEVRAYALALRDLGGAAEEIEALRRKLVDRVEPRAAAARAALLEVCVPFGIDDAFLASELVHHQVDVGRLARLQIDLERAEAHESALRTNLDGALSNLGFGEGELSARAGAFEWAHTRAVERERARSSARDVDEVEAELAKLEDEARRTRRPEFMGVTPAEADEPDLEALLLRRDATVAAHGAGRSLLPDVARLADRHSALERRVGVLESSFKAQPGDDTTDADVVRQYLLARLTQARGGDPEGEAVPVIVDEALLRLQGDAKWELLDLLERVSEKCQLVYLTDDPYVGAWARRRAPAGTLTLLEPLAVSV